MTGLLKSHFMQAVEQLALDEISAEAFDDLIRAHPIAKGAGASMSPQAMAQAAAHHVHARIAQELGSGSDGITYLLDDGRIMKSSLKGTEAAVASVLSSCSLDELPAAIPLFFRSDIPAAKNVTGLWHFFLREEVPDMPESLAGLSRDEWATLLEDFEHAWVAHDVNALNLMVQKTRLLEDLYDALEWMEDGIGFTLTDLKPENLGWTGRNLVIRDFSRGKPSPLLYRLAAANGMELSGLIDDAIDFNAWDEPLSEPDEAPGSFAP